MADNLTMPKMAWYKRKLILIILALIIVTVVVAAVGFLKFSSEPVAIEPEVDNTTLYVGMSQPFIFAVVAGRRERLVQIEVQLMVRGAQGQVLAQRHLPLLESTLLTVFSGQTADNYLTAEGKITVKQEALDELNAVLTDQVGSPLVEKVLFTNIVMQ
ncbi:flagellar basal body-associated protein FliL [Oceanisphaera profunda]|uniref:Flagellar protein FliL n=1 Tax=Oceanisphaera profunda TaxID=1416627 RepID=A0A1Y0D763_9GAMM|nr:flagellar basal body-associated FliL family protein [Oceanisphaera profunda]ART83381.1 flagellar basal body-associated protein FliL [Oceanisphaera profunda]